MVKEESVDSHGKRLVSIELFYLPSAEEENCTAIYDPVRVEVDLGVYSTTSPGNIAVDIKKSRGM